MQPKVYAIPLWSFAPRMPRRTSRRHWCRTVGDAAEDPAFGKKAVEQNEFHRRRRDPNQKFRRDPYQKVMGWLLPRAAKS